MSGCIWTRYRIHCCLSNHFVVIFIETDIVDILIFIVFILSVINWSHFCCVCGVVWIHLVTGCVLIFILYFLIDFAERFIRQEKRVAHV